MFSNNPSFNLDLSSWDVASAEYMGYMFAATALNYSYCAWGERVPSDVDVTEMFSQTNCPDVNDPDTASLAGSSWCYSC